MARAFSKDVANYMTLGADAIAPLLNGAAKLSVGAWINAATFTNGANDNGIINIHIDGTAVGLQLNIGSAANTVRCAGRSQAADALQASNGSAVSTATWHHIGGVLDVSGDTIRTYLNGVQGSSTAVTFGATTWTRATPTGTDFIGARTSAAPPTTAQQLNGSLAELAVWIDDIGTAGFAALADGISPMAILPTALVDYWPLIGYASPEIDRFGAKSGTITGTVAAAAHMRVIYPEPRIFIRAAAAAAGDAVPQVWAQYRRRHSA